MSEALSPAACQISSTRTALCLKLEGTFAGCACKENISQISGLHFRYVSL